MTITLALSIDNLNAVFYSFLSYIVVAFILLAVLFTITV